MKVIVMMETSGQMRRLLASQGVRVISVDLLPAQDDVEQIAIADLKMNKLPKVCHIVGDVFEVMERLWPFWWPDAIIAHPDCTFLTASAEWAYKDPDFDRYPGVGYHQRLKPGTLFGQARRDARDAAVALVQRIWAYKVRAIVIENPIGALSKRFMKPTTIVQPYWFGDDASKKTCLWTKGLENILIDPANRFPGRWVYDKNLDRVVERWSNQTDQGQNNIGPSDDRWQDRADTYPGIAAAVVNRIMLDWGWLLK